MFTTYVLYSESADRLYIGYSSDYLKRFLYHNELSKKGFTYRYRPWKIIHTEHFDTKAEAMAREKALKSGQGRQWIWEAKVKLAGLYGQSYLCVFNT